MLTLNFESALDVANRLGYTIPTNMIEELNTYVQRQCVDMIAKTEGRYCEDLDLIVPTNLYDAKKIEKVEKVVEDFCFRVILGV
jgi:hypothetical protein